ncbi:hypothetical protein PHYSODRAFT_478379, partial [Phytophthora sojae]
RDYGREMGAQGLKQARIRVAMARRFVVAVTEMPTLRQVQWFIDQLEFGPATTDTQPFSFGWDRDGKGKPDLRNGHDEDPVFVGLTTKALLRNAARDPNSFVFHMDGTFQLNQVAYPVIICDVWDRGRSFHLVTVFVVSQRLEGIYVQALTALRTILPRGRNISCCSSMSWPTRRLRS